MVSSNFRSVDPIKPVAPYIGGKKNLAKRLVPMIEAIDHTTYVDVFGGMGGVFLRRTQAPKAEVFNDKSADVATFFRVLQRHYVPFMDMMRFQLTTRHEFERLQRTDASTLTDLERAARFLYLQSTAFGGKVEGRNFGVSPGRPARFDITKLGETLEDLHMRLASVTIECLDYQDLIPRYDRQDTLFYLDPPYYGSEDDYGRWLFGRVDYERLALLLRNLKGRFILSLNDVQPVREIFDGFQIEAVETTYTISKEKEGRGKVGEVIISNCKSVDDEGR